MRYVCFDLDDTLIDFTSNVASAGLQAAERIAHRYGIPAAGLNSAFGAEATRFWADPDLAREGRRDLIATSARIMQRAGAALGLALTTDEALLFSREYRVLRDEGVTMVSGALDVLGRLRAESATLALITNGSQAEQRTKIARFDLERYFDLVVIEGELGVGKPDKRVFRHALERLAALPEDTVMVGNDLGADIAGAQSVGIRGVWVDVVGAGLPAGAACVPDRIIRSVAEL